MLHRLREACGVDAELLSGEVEVDEVYIGGKEANGHESKKLKAIRGAVGKQTVLGMTATGGSVTAKPIADTQSTTIGCDVYAGVKSGITLYTDEHAAYRQFGDRYHHQTVNHTVKEFVNSMASTNSIESFWAVLKRGLNGVYYQWSKNHMTRYINEFTFRLDEGNVAHHTMK